MAFRKPDEMTITCPQCGTEYPISDSRVEHGIFNNKKLFRCSVCFERFKHEFWLRRIIEEEE